jgi:hypothetical protein
MNVRGLIRAPQLIETCHIVSAQLSGELSQSDLDILADDVDFFVVSLVHLSSVSGACSS